MFLSNPRKSFLLTVFFALTFQACGSSAGNVNSPVSLTGDTKSEFPFLTKEPEVYQGELVVTTDNAEDHFFIARNGANRRLDTFTGRQRAVTELIAGPRYMIDHRRKIFYTESGVGSGPGAIDMPVNFFHGNEYYKFEEVGRANGLINYKARMDERSRDDVLITIDQASGVMVREEFISNDGPEKVIYEFRDLKLNADDSIFQVPAGYRKVTVEGYRQNPNK